ncbi:HNH/endonuclease VII fold putative polymorphic toxin [Streptomyces sp. NBC_00358]
MYKRWDPSITKSDYNPRGSWGRYYQYETPHGMRVIAEHTADPNAPLSHFHAGTPQAGEPADVNMTGKIYKELQPKRHLYYEQGKCGG